MDDITRQFLAVIRKIKTDIDGALEELRSIHETNDPGYEKYDPNGGRETSKVESLTATIKGFQEMRDSNEAKKYALDHRRYRLEWKGYRVSRGTAVFLLIYTIITGLIAIYSIRSANAAKESSDTAKQTMILSQRPWLGKETVLGLKISIVNTNVVAGELDFTAKNFGHSPALKVGVGAFPFIRTRGDDGDFTRAREEACKWADTSAQMGGDANFPEQTKQYNAMVLWQVENVEKSKMILVAACIAYRDQFDITRSTHHTGFCVMGTIANLQSLYGCGTEEIAD
jgi:hypothetical protein